jgi:hypothetical protein
VHSARVSSEQVSGAQAALGAYLDRYRQRLKGKNLVYVNQLLHVLKQLTRFFNQHERKLTTVSAAAAAAASTATPVGLASKACSSNRGSGGSVGIGGGKAYKEIYTINGLLFELGIDNLNLLKLERYREGSRN